MKALTIFGFAALLTLMTIIGACTKKDAGPGADEAKKVVEPAVATDAKATEPPRSPAKVRLSGFICGLPDPTDPQKVQKRQYTIHPETGAIRCIMAVEKAPEGGKFICGLRSPAEEFGAIERPLPSGDSTQVCDFTPPTGGWQPGGLSFFTRQLDAEGNSLNGSSTGLSVKDAANSGN